MKKIILLILLSLSIQMADAQRGSNQRTGRETLRGKTSIKRLNATHGRQLTPPTGTNKLYKASLHTLNSQLEEVLDTISNQLKKDSITEYSYTGGNFSTQTCKTWDEGASQAEFDNKTDFSHDSKGNVTLALNSLWDESTKVWYNNYKDEYTFNASNAVLTNLYYEWDDINGVWDKISKLEYTYDVNGNLLTDTYSEWDGSKYEIFDRIVYTYDAKGNKLTDTYSTYNGGWLVVDKYDNTYDANNNLLTSLYTEWNDLSKQWVNKSKDVYTYDTYNNMLTDIYSSWDIVRSLWVNTDKTDNTYDSKNNQTLSIISTWDARGAKWVNSIKTEATFDGTVSGSMMRLPFDEETKELYFKTKLEKKVEFTWNKTTSIWITTAQITYNYTIENVGINESGNNYKIAVYPNPAHSMAHIKVLNRQPGMEIIIYDMTGEVFQSKDLDKTGMLDVEGLRSGLYLIQLTNGQNLLASRKLVVE